MLAALEDPDWKVRRNAAVSLGRASDDALAGPLRDALGRERDPAVRASLTLAFGRFAAPSDLPWLEGLEPSTEGERRAARTVIETLAARTQVAPAVVIDRPLAGEARPELWSRRGLARVVAAEGEARGLATRTVDEERVAVGGEPTFEALLEVRSALHPVLVCALPVEDPAAAGRLFAASAVAREMKRLTPGEVPSYRLTLEGVARRRPWIDAFTGTAAGLVNGATGYSWEVIVRPRRRELLLAARPSTAPDPRFAYRERDLPASIHPTLAAAAAFLVPARERDVVVDPFCGSGTLLVERARRGACRQLVGIDHQAAALAAARTNLASVAPDAELLEGDFSSAERFRPIDVILTNPPYGRRIAAAARTLHARLDALAARVLSPGGHLAVFRPAELPGPAALAVVQRLDVDAGGLAVRLWVARRRG